MVLDGIQNHAPARPVLPRSPAAPIVISAPLRGVPASAWAQLEQALTTARIDQSLVLDLITGGLGSTDLGPCVAHALVCQLQRTEPVAAQWCPLVLQALRDPREVWEPAYVGDRARLRAHLQQHPGTLLRGLYFILLRPWTLSPLAWQERLAGLAADTCPMESALGAARAEALRVHRNEARVALRAVWEDTWGLCLTEPMTRRCLARVNRLNRCEPGLWEPLLAIDLVREQHGGSSGLGGVLQKTHLRSPVKQYGVPHPVARVLLNVAAQASRAVPPGMPPRGSASRGSALALCALLLSPALHPLLQPAAAVPAVSPRGGVPARSPATGTRAGALTPLGLPVVTATGAVPCTGAAAVPAGPPFVADRSGGLRPDEARTTVASRFTADVCARWLGVFGRTASDFNAGIRALLRRAGVPFSQQSEPDAAIDALFEHGDPVFAETLRQATLPLLAHRLLERAQPSTRIYLVALGLSRLFKRIRPRQQGDPAMREAAQWICSVDRNLRAWVSHTAVRDAVDTGDAARWLGDASSTTHPTPQNCAQAIADAWDPQFRPDPVVAWPYGSPQFRASGWFVQPTPAVDRPTLALATLVFSLANPILEAREPGFSRHALPSLSGDHWQQHCARFDRDPAGFDAATCLQIAWHRIARQLEECLQRRALMDASDDSIRLRAQLRGLIVPLHRRVETLQQRCADDVLVTRARRSFQQFLTLTRQHRHLHDRTATSVSDAVHAVLPGNASALASVLAHVLGQQGFPDADDLETRIEHLYTSKDTQSLIARALGLPLAAIDNVVTLLFFMRLAAVPISIAAQATSLQAWQQQLRLRSPRSGLRGARIEQLSPRRAAALFERDDLPGLHALLDLALDIPVHAEHRWRLRQQAPQRLAAWLDSTVGRQRMADILAPPGDATQFMFGDSGLPAAYSVKLLTRAVRHHLDDALPATLQTLVEQARQAPSPALSLAVTLHAQYPLLPAQACLTHAAVLLIDAPPWTEPAPFALQFPLPPWSANATPPAATLASVLDRSGIAWLEQIDPALPAGQAWELLASTQGFHEVACGLLKTNPTQLAVVDRASAQQAVAQWVLARGIGADAVASLSAALDDADAHSVPMLRTREAVRARLPALRSALAAEVLWWLLARHSGRPEWAVADVPDYLDYGRSLHSVTLLQAVAMCEAAAPGATADLSANTLARLPGRLPDSFNATVPEHGQTWLHALVRPALLYAAAHSHIVLAAGTAGATMEQAHAAVCFVRERQSGLVQAADQLRQPAPQRRPLAAHQLHAAGIPDTYWNRTLAEIPYSVLTAAGVVRRATRDVGLEGMSLVFGDMLRPLEDVLVADSLQELLVGGGVELEGHPSIAQLFDQAYTLYRQQMTAALEVLLARSLDGLPASDRQLLQRARVTPLLVPGASHGVLLRCEPASAPGADPGPDPVYLAVVPAAGFSVRLRCDRLRIDGQWRSGVVYPHSSFVSGVVPDRLEPQHLRLLDVPRLRCGSKHSPRGNASGLDPALMQATAELMYGDFFDRTRQAELRRRTGKEELQAVEADVADALARFALPFYGCAKDVVNGDVRAAVVDCTIDALALVAPEAGLGRFLRSSATLVLHAGDMSVRALLHDAGAALLKLGEDVAAQSGLRLLHDLGRGAVKLGRGGAFWLLKHIPALESRLVPTLEAARMLRSTTVLDGHLLDEEAMQLVAEPVGCARMRRQVNVARCTSEAVELFQFTPSPVFDSAGDVTWFAGMQVASGEPLTAAGRHLIVDGEYWHQVASGTGFRYTRDSSRGIPVARQRIRAKVVGGESQLVRVELHNPYPDHLLRVTQGAVVGRARDGSRAVITRLAPGRFHVATLPHGADLRAGQALEFRPLEQQGFSSMQNDAVKAAWWGAFHYSQQCQLSGAALVDRFGSQLQRQLEHLDALDQLLQEVRASSPFTFHTLPAQAVMSCAQSNCRYVQALRQQIGTAYWRAPRADDAWINDALRDLLSPPGSPSSQAFTTLDDTLEARFLMPRRGPAKTLAIAEVTLKDDPVPLVFHATSGQRKGRSLLPLSNLEHRHAPTGWQVDGKTVTTPRARYIDAQPSVSSITQGDVSGVVPNHSLHAEDLDGRLFHERNARHLDAERNLYYRVERYITEGKLDPTQVTSLRLFSSRRICASCHISVGSLRARFPGAHFEVVERDVQAAGAALDRAAETGS